jgi:hypothetical protein
MRVCRAACGCVVYGCTVCCVWMGGVRCSWGVDVQHDLCPLLPSPTPDEDAGRSLRGANFSPPPSIYYLVCAALTYPVIQDKDSERMLSVAYLSENAADHHFKMNTIKKKIAAAIIQSQEESNPAR